MKDQKSAELIDQEDFDTLNELIVSKKITLNTDHCDALSDIGYNTCSCCGYIDESEYLIWIDSDDFELFEG